MNKYLVHIALTATYNDCLEVEAENECEAESKAELQAREMLADIPIEQFEKDHGGVTYTNGKLNIIPVKDEEQ